MRKVAAILGCLVCLCGCTASHDDKRVVRISNWGGAGEDGAYNRLVQRLYDDFGKKNGVDVRVEGIPGEYQQKMLLNHIAGTMPDVMQVDASSSAIFVNNGVLRDLTSYVQADPTFRLADYYPNALDIGTRGQRLFTIPGDFTPMAVYYNKALFDAAHVPYPKADWTFADFLATAQKLTNPEKKQYGFVFSNWMPGWVMWLWNNGGEVLSPDGRTATGFFDSAKNVETVTFLRDLVKTRQVAPSFSQAASLGVDLFANGQAAMTVSGHWAIVGFKAAKAIDWTRLAVVPMPHNTPKSQTVMYEMGFGIPAQCKNPDLAWKLVKAWTSANFQRVYNASGIAICGRKDISRERATTEIEKQFLEIVPTARPPAGASIEGYEAVENAGAKMMDRVLNTDVSVAVALHDAAQRIDKEFAKR